MAKRKDKPADKVQKIYELLKTGHRDQWEYINQKGYDFAHDNQMTDEEKKALEDQGMPTFTINRIIPVVEMLNFYATSNRPRWQAVGVDGSDSDVASVFSDIADYIWNNSNGDTLISNAVNDAVTKSLGYLVVTVDPNQDQGMGEVTIQQPDPFDVFVDQKSRDILFRDAAYIMIRKVMPKGHLKNTYPEYARKIENANSNLGQDHTLSEKVTDNSQKDFHYKDIIHVDNYIHGDESNELITHFELYEKIKVANRNVFYRIPPTNEQMQQIQQQVKVQVEEMQKEMEVSFKEKQTQMEQAVQSGQMLPERMQLELEKEQKMMVQQLETFKKQLISDLQNNVSKVENKVISEKEFNIMMKNEQFASTVIDAIKYHDTKIRMTVVVGDKTLYEKIIPISEYPVIPIHYKWTGTPFPISAVSPLIGKQRELNKAHQLMVHNASLGSSLRWMYEEGSIDTDYWEQYSSAPGALLPKRPGYEPPTPVQPFQLNNAFFGLVQNGKADMEYLAGIYASMQGDTGSNHETFRGMLALDEYGTRRIKYWLKNSIEPALKQVGEVVKQYSQLVYTANKVFRVVQPNAIREEKQVEINIPMYNDLGEAIGKWKDYGAAKFDIRIVKGSTLPVNRWAYLAELKELMQLGVVDDIAVLSETDIKNKENIAKRKSLYSQLQGQISSMEEQLKNSNGTIETLERQLVQAGIKSKVQQGSMEAQMQMKDASMKTQNEHKLLRSQMKGENELMKKKAEMVLKDLQMSKKDS